MPGRSSFCRVFTILKIGDCNPLQKKTEDDYKLAATYLQGLSEMEAKNIISSLVVKGTITKDDLEELKKAKKTLFNEIERWIVNIVRSNHS